MIKQCKRCGEDFEAFRATKLFCNDKCKVAFSRTPEKEVVEQVELPEKKVAIPTEVKKEVKEGYCHGCGEKVHELACICLACVGKGVTHRGLGIRMCGDSEDLTREDLETNIRLYEHDTWKDSPEFIELKRRLDTLEELRGV